MKKTFNPAFTILLSVLCVNIGSFMVIPFYTVYFHHNFNISLTIIALALSISIVTTRIISLLAGMLIDRLATKLIMFVGLQTCALAYFGLANTQTGFNLVIFSFAYGLGNALFTIASKVVLLQIENLKISQASLLSLRNIMLNCGAVIGPLIGSFLIYNSAKMLFLTVALFYSLSGLFIVFCLGNQKTNKLRSAPNFKEIGRSLFKVEILPLFCLSSIFMVGYCQIQLTLPLFANNISAHWGILTVYIINAALIASASLPVAAFFIKDHSAIKMSFLGVVFVAISFVFLYFTHDLLTLIISVVLLSIGEILFFPAADLAISKMFPAAMTGTAIGVIQLAYGFGGVVGNTASGYLYNMLSVANNERFFWLIIGSFILFCTFIISIKAKLVTFVLPRNKQCKKIIQL